MYALRKVWKPEIFQGAGKKAGYFEGWYFKCVSRDEGEGYAFIPGIAYSEDDPHAFLQIFDGKRGTYQYVRYPAEDFSYSKKDLFIRIGGSEFSKEKIKLNVRGDGLSVTGSLRLGAFTPWPVRLFSPGAMGWYAFVPKMEDYHGVLSFHHELAGILEINEKKRDFTGGIGYVEKDWGTSFPGRWIWMQTNNYSGTAASLSLSVATIPWRKNQFTGYIIGFRLDGELYPFSTYAGGKIVHYSVSGGNKVDLIVQSRRYELRISAEKIGGTDLKAPVAGNMSGRVHESLRSEVDTELRERRGGTVLFAGRGTSAGIELHGDIDGLLSEAVAARR